MKASQIYISHPSSISDDKSDNVDCQVFNIVRRSHVLAIDSAKPPVFLDVFADFIVGDDGEPVGFSSQNNQQKAGNG
jgi:hypothetical protein